VGVKSTSTKFMPEIVTSVMVVRAMLAAVSKDTTGASHEKDFPLVPTTADTVTMEESFAPATASSAGTLQRIDEVEVQIEV
jgi:hypothetical protein